MLMTLWIYLLQIYQICKKTAFEMSKSVKIGDEFDETVKYINTSVHSGGRNTHKYRTKRKVKKDAA